MTPHLPPALRRVQSTYMLSTEPLRPTHSRSRSVVRLLGGWPEKKIGHSAQEFVDDLKLQRYRMSEFPDSLRGSATSSNRSSKHRSLSPGRNYDSGDDASDEASSSSPSDCMSTAEPDIVPAAERAHDLGDGMMVDAEDAKPAAAAAAAAEAEPAAVMAPPSAPKKPRYAPRFLPYAKTPPRGYKVLQKANAVDGADHRWSPPGDGFTRKEARPLGVCIGSSKRKLSDLAAAVGFLDLTPQSDARDLGWAAAPCEAAAEMETPRKRRLAPGFSAARDMDLDESLRRGRPRMRRLAAKPRSPARAPSVRAPEKAAAAAQPQPETALDTGGCGGSSLSAATVHCSHPLSLRPGLPRPPPQNVVPATPRDAFVLVSLTP